MVERKLDGAVDKSSADRKIRKWDTAVHNLCQNLEACTYRNPVLQQAGRLADEIWVRLEILKACCKSKNSIFRFA